MEGGRPHERTVCVIWGQHGYKCSQITEESVTRGRAYIEKYGNPEEEQRPRSNHGDAFRRVLMKSKSHVFLLFPFMCEATQHSIVFPFIMYVLVVLIYGYDGKLNVGMNSPYIHLLYAYFEILYLNFALDFSLF